MRDISFNLEEINILSQHFLGDTVTMKLIGSKYNCVLVFYLISIAVCIKWLNEFALWSYCSFYTSFTKRTICEHPRVTLNENPLGYSFWFVEISEGILRDQKIIIGLDSFCNQRLIYLDSTSLCINYSVERCKITVILFDSMSPNLKRVE